MEDYFHPNMTFRQVNAMSALALAHMGDCVFEILVRTFLCCHGGATNGNLHRETVSYVSAPAQSKFVARLLPRLTPEETALYKRGRNAHVHGVPKNATPGEYARATGLEALFGALYLMGQEARISELFTPIMEEIYAI